MEVGIAIAHPVDVRIVPSRASDPRRRVLALFLPLAAALLVSGEVLTPTGLDKPLTTTGQALRELPIAAAHSDRLYFSNLLVIAGLAALAVSFSAIAALVRVRGAALATTAAVIGGIGGFCGAIVNVLIGFNLAAAATAHTAPVAAADVLVSANTATVAKICFVGYLGGVASATVFSGTALWRSGTVPRWLPVLFVLGVVAAALAPPGAIAIPLSLPFVVATVVLAGRACKAVPTSP